MTVGTHPHALARPAKARLGLKHLITDIFLAVLIAGFPVAFVIQEFLGMEENLITLAARALTVGFAIATLLARNTAITRRTGWFLLALLGFASLYGYAMLDQLVLEGEYSLAPPSVMFSLFFGIGIFPAFVILLCNVDYEQQPLRMRALLRLLLWANTVFLTLALFNGRDLLGTEFGRFKSEGGINQIYMGHMGVMNLYLVFFLATLERASISLLTKALMVFATGLALFMIVLAGSRGPFVALYAVALFIFFSRVKSSSGLLLCVAGLTSILAFVLFVDPYEFRDLTGSNLLIRMFDNDDLRDEPRYIAYQLAWESFLRHPIIGEELLINSTYPHNFLLEILMSTGLVGMVLFLMLYLPAWKECLSACFGGRQSMFHVFFVHVTVVFLFSGAVWGMHLLWTALALVLAINVSRARRPPSPRPARPPLKRSS